MSLFIPIAKVDVARRLVHGILSEEVPDKAGEILDYESAKPAFAQWSEEIHAASGGKSLGNVRAMHGAVAAGKFTDIVFDDANRRIEGVAKIIDDDEWQKVLEGVYTGFSIGGGYARRWPDAEHPGLMRYTPVLAEVSLVDNPAVPTATFQVIKIDGSVELRKFYSFSRDATAMDEMSKALPMPVEANDEARAEALLGELTWLRSLIENDAEDDVLAAIDTLEAYLSDSPPESEAAEEANPYIDTLSRRAPREDSASPALEKRIVHLTETVAGLKARLAELEAQPLPAKGALRAIGKADDQGTELARLTPAQRTHELMKLALANPVHL